MLLEQRIKEIKHLSASEKMISDYILNIKDQIQYLSTRDIAKATYTSSATVVRFAQKLGYLGFNELKQDYLTELNYIHRHFQNVDANYPFNSHDSMNNIIGKMQQLFNETIDDTLSLIQLKDIENVISLLDKCDTIAIFGLGNASLFGERFQHQMLRINKKVVIETKVGEYGFSTHTLTHHDCAIVISYSGETETVINYAKLLKQKHIPIIALTSMGGNTLSQYAQYVLPISTREKQYSKISSFSSDYSILYLLDLLYCGYFALNYDHHLKSKIALSKLIEKCHTSHNEIIHEDDI
mgnify:CR=1 FL=1